MNEKPTLKLNWCSYEAAKYAVEHWHYSWRMPVGKSVKVGAWEGDAYIGAIVFTWGANRHLATQFHLRMTQCVELVRVALTKHVAPVSQIISLAVKFLRRQSPGILLVVSFSDPAHGHHGGIYQAMGWIYSGTSAPVTSFRRAGVTLMRRAYTGRQFGKVGSRAPLPGDACAFVSPGKHRYLMPLDAEMRARILLLAKPYPKRAGSIAANAPADQAGGWRGSTDPGASVIAWPCGRAER